MHFCADELMALLAAVPFLGMLSRQLHAWWHARRCPHAPAPVKHSPDPVRYFTSDDVAKSQKDGPGDITAPGWYFYDETWAFVHGPFGTEKECRMNLAIYCQWLNGELNDSVLGKEH